jgi:UPF0755 protein
MKLKNPFNKKVRNVRKFIIFVIFIIVICICYSVSSLFRLESNQKATINIKSGATTTEIAEQLKEKNIIKSKMVYQFLSKYYKYDGKYKSGSFSVNTNKGYKGIMIELTKGNGMADYVKVTIPEGFTVKQIAEKLAETGLVDKDKFIKAANRTYDYPFLKDNIGSKIKLEGYLFPDTYYIKKHKAADDIVKMMLDRFNYVFTKKYYDRSKTVNISVREAIIMASVVEREAEAESERPIVARVFYNRLNKKMKLQSCATVQYVLDKHKQVLSLNDIKVNSPYNTYKNIGLPAGPICNPGIKSIEAALYPAKATYLYFVAKGDGTHYFSNTYAEHVNAQKKYQSKTN